MIKWIGQHIFDFVAKFRSKVYIQELPVTSLNASKIPVIKDSDGQVSYINGIEVSDTHGIKLAPVDGSGDIEINPAGSGKILLKASSILMEGSGSINVPSIKLSEYTGSGGEVVGFRPPASIAADCIWTLPAADGSSGQVMVTDGSKALTFATVISEVTDTTSSSALPVVLHDESNNLHDDTGTFTYQPSTGNLVVPKTEVSKREYAIPSAGVGNANGDVLYAGVNSSFLGNAVAAGKIYVYGAPSVGASNGTWTETDASAANTSTGLLAVALGTSTTTDGMLLRGMVDLNNNVVGTETAGMPLYLSETTGYVTTTAPTTSGAIVRVIGYAMEDGDDNRIWFNPDNSWTVVP